MRNEKVNRYERKGEDIKEKQKAPDCCFKKAEFTKNKNRQ